MSKGKETVIYIFQNDTRINYANYSTTNVQTL